MPDDSNDGSTAFLKPGELPKAQARMGPRDTDSSENVSVEVESESPLPTEQSVSKFAPAPRPAMPPANPNKAQARIAIPVSALPLPKRPVPVTSPDPVGIAHAKGSPDEAGDPSKAKKELLTPEAEGRYLMKREFGRGGMSSVWLALDRHVGREVAFKQLLPQHARASQDPAKATLQQRFVNEARITGQLEHPNIVPVYEVGRRPDGATYYTLKLVKGKTLTEALKGCKDLRERVGLLPNFIALCQAIAYAHKRTVIHRDLKPDNVMVGEFGETVVLDWGLARFLDKPDAKDESLASTQEGDVMGTPAYMSPEQALGANDQVDTQSDVWSLGAVLFEILTGRPPFQGRNLMQMLMMVAKEPPPKVRSLEPKVPPELAAVVEKALTREKRNRYRSATELLNDVEAWRTGGRVSVFKYTAAQSVARWVRKNRYVVLTAALVLLAVVGGAVRVWMENQVARRNLAQAYLEKASTASRDLRWGRAAAYAAVARVEDDTAEARWRAAWRGPVDLDPALRMTLPAGAEQLALSPDGRKVAVAVLGKGLKLIEVATGKALVSIDLEGPASALAFSADGGMVATGVGKVIQIWSAVSGEAQMRIDAAGPVGDLAFAPDGSRFAAAEGSVARLYEAGEWRAVATLEGHQGAVNSVAFSSDLKLLLTAGEDGTLRAWSPLPLTPESAKGKGPRPEMRMVRGTGHAAVAHAFFTPNSHTVVSSAADMTVRFIDGDTGAPLRRINGDGPFLAMAGSADGLYAALSQDNRVMLIDAGSQGAVARLDTDDAANSVALAADGGVVAIANRDGKLRVWKLTPGARVLSLPAPKGFGVANAVAVAPSGRRAAVGDAAGHLLVFDLPTGKMEKTLEVPQGEIAGLAWSPGAGKWIAAVGAEETVSLFEAATGARTALEGHTGPVNAVAFHPEGKLLATAGSDGTVRLWDVGSPAPRATINASEKPLNAVAFSVDGKLLAAGGEDHGVRIFETQSRKQKRKIEGLPAAVLSLAFSPHASILATSGRDQVVRTFRVSTGEARAVWSGHGARVRAIAFAPDGETLASASSDGTIRIWDVRTGRQVVRLERPPEARALAYSKDGSLLISAGEKPALLAVEVGDKSNLLAPEAELARQLKRRKLRLEGIELVEDDEQLAQKTLGKAK